ncbi:MAG: TraX family protein [Proteocatella sp.]
MKKLNSLQIKLFMAFLMVFDHIPYFVSPGLALFFHVITRCVGVWFAYVAVEGFIHTSSKFKYNRRLFVWAGIMLAGNGMLNFMFKSKPEIGLHNNIFLTLAMGVLILNVLHSTKKETKASGAIRVIAAAVLFVSAVLFTEGGLIVIPFMLISYFFKDRIKLRDGSYLILAAMLLFMSYQPYDTLEMTIKMLLYNGDFFFITVIPFIHMYGGERGPNSKLSKYFFYVFYPAHLWIIAAIAYYIKL